MSSKRFGKPVGSNVLTSDFGFRGQIFGFRGTGSGFRVSGFGVRVSGSGVQARGRSFGI